MIIDFHTHVFPEKIAEKAMDKLCKSAGNAEPFIDGTTAGLFAHMEKHGINKSVVLNIATNKGQQKNVNDFANAINSERLIAFGSVHPDAENAVEELHRIKEMGLKGIKLHPDYQGFFVDDDRLFPIYETVDKLGLILTFHAGVDIQYFEPVHCTPERLMNILPLFKNTSVIAAHMGGYMRWYEVEEFLVGKDVYFDTSYSYMRLPGPHAKRIIVNHGADKILFGSDLPWSGSHNEKRFVESMDLERQDTNAILSGNAVRLLGL